MALACALRSMAWHPIRLYNGTAGHAWLAARAFSSSRVASSSRKLSALYFGTDEFASEILQAVVDNMRKDEASPLKHIEAVW